MYVGMSQILVTGAKGLVGSWTVQELVETGVDVIGVDLTRPAEGRLPSGVGFLAADTADYGAISQIIQRQDPDKIVHLAAVPHANVKPASSTFRNNILSAYNVFESAKLNDADVIWTSSVEIHGDAKANFEQDEIPFNTDLPIHPPNSYSMSKVLCERLAECYTTTTDISITTIRPGFVNEPGRYKTKQIREWFNPEDTDPSDDINTYFWSYIDARDLASLISSLCNEPIQGHETFFAVADDTYVDIKTRELVSKVFDIDIGDTDLPEYGSLYSTEKAKQRVGWKPKHSWREAESPSEDLETPF